MKKSEIKEGHIYKCSWNHDTIYPITVKVLKISNDIVKYQMLLKDKRKTKKYLMLLSLFAKWVRRDINDTNTYFNYDTLNTLRMVDSEQVIPTSFEVEELEEDIELDGK